MPYLNKPKRIRNQSLNRLNRLKVYQTAKWRRLRQSKILLNPLCELCLEEGIIRPAEDVHHIISPFSCDPSYKEYYAYDFNNLMSLCKLHHAYIHSEHKEKDYYNRYYEKKNEVFYD